MFLGAGLVGTVMLAMASTAVAEVPSVAFSTPAAGATLGTGSFQSSFSTSGSPTSILCTLDSGGSWPCSSPVTLGGMLDGAHTLAVTVSNSTGSETATRSFNWDTRSPVFVPDPSTYAKTYRSSQSVPIKFQAIDGSTVGNYNCVVDFPSSLTMIPCGPNSSIPAQAVGSHSVFVMGTDAAGNQGAEYIFFRVANLPPQSDTQAPSQPNGVTTQPDRSSSTRMVSWNASTDNDSIARYDVFVDGALYGSRVAPATSLTLARQTCGVAHTVSIVAADPTGNVSPSSLAANFTVDCGIGGSGETMPVGNIPGWSQVFAEDFSAPAATGSMASPDPETINYIGATGTKWRSYPPNYPDTRAGRPYRSDQVLSVHDGVMDFFLHEVDGRPAGASPSPLVTGTSQYQTYGRYSARVRIPGGQTSNYYMAWLLWTEHDLDGGYGESDWPEGVLNNNGLGFEAVAHHGPNFDIDKQGCGNATISLANTWRTFTQEWTPTERRYYIDGFLFCTVTRPTWAGPERWQLQTETLPGNLHQATHLLVDWAVVYAPS